MQYVYFFNTGKDFEYPLIEACIVWFGDKAGLAYINQDDKYVFEPL